MQQDKVKNHRQPTTHGESTMVAKQENKDVQEFNRRSMTYEDSLEQWFFFDRLHKAVLDLVESRAHPKSIVDVGCGTGRLLRKARERWPDAQLIGVDPAEGMVEKARSLMPSATFYVSMAESLPLPDASADLVFSTMSYHHWADQVKGVREMARVLRPKGHLFLADIWPPIGLAKVMRHFQSNDPARVREVLTQAGLKIQAQRRRRGLWLLVTIGERQ
jgi:ubiquinone/menaquinone biosynthesis C-methylase UbiE